MNLYKCIIKKIKNIIKKFLKRLVNFPDNSYQNLYTKMKIHDFHSGEFDFYHNKFSINDHHLNNNINKTRYRNYVNFKFAEQAIRNSKSGSFLSVGISYGTTVKVITHLLDKKVKKMNYFMIDDYNNVGI